MLGLVRTGFYLPLVVCTYLALIPEPPQNAVFQVSDIILHAFAFTYLTFALCLMRLAAQPQNATLGWPLVRNVFLVMLGYGVFLEAVQGFIPARTAELKDLGVDALGIGFGLLLAALLAAPVIRVIRLLSRRIGTGSDR